MVSIGARVKALRKELSMSQTVFGDKLGATIDVIANIEHERLAKPEQKEPLYKLICKTFNVSYEWLTTGEGDMFVVTRQSFLERLSTEFGLSLTAQKIVECYLNLDEGQRAAVDDFVNSIAESISSAEAPIQVQETVASDVIDKTIDIYRAADSQAHTEHEVIAESQSKIDRFNQLPKVTKKEDF